MMLTRFGATWTRYGGYLLVLGGVLRQGIVPQSHDILICSLSDSICDIRSRVVDPRMLELSRPPRPLIIGSSILLTEAGQVVLMGGGATCFSMGTFWTSGIYAFSLDSRGHHSAPALNPSWELTRTVELVDRDEGAHMSSKQAISDGKAPVLPILRMRVHSAETFGQVLLAGKPVILEGADLGARTHNWSLDYLVDKIGQGRKASHHCFCCYD